MLRETLLAMAALGTSAASQPNDNDSVRAIAQVFDDAQLHGDRAMLDRLLAPDFLLVRGSGRVGDRRDFIDGFTDPGSRLGSLQISDRLLLRPTADTAIVGGEAWVRGIDGGKPFARHFRYADTFARREGNWLVIYTQITPLPGE
jgi:hypothetical protein